MNYEELTSKAKRLVRLECLKIGSAVALEPREVNGVVKYQGDDLFRWFGEDQKDRVLRIIVVITDDVVVVSAAVATTGQEYKYREEDQEGLATELDEEEEESR